jgi:hypothetical protein
MVCIIFIVHTMHRVMELSQDELAGRSLYKVPILRRIAITTGTYATRFVSIQVVRIVGVRRADAIVGRHAHPLV